MADNKDTRIKYGIGDTPYEIIWEEGTRCKRTGCYFKGGFVGHTLGLTMTSRCNTVEEAKRELFEAIPKRLKSKIKELEAKYNSIPEEIREIGRRLEIILNAENLDEFEVKEE